VADVESRMARATFLWRAVGAERAPDLPRLDSLVIPDLDSLVDSAAVPDSLRDSVPRRDSVPVRDSVP